MILIIGGYGQGKRTLAEQVYGISSEQIADGATCALVPMPNARAIDRLHILIRRLIQAGESPQEYVLRLVEQTPEVLLICDEIGCGIVPMDAFEREWREQTGRICCWLAQRSRCVERVTAGLATRLKGENK